jgi:aldehyde:ferredoxin oxidoreductase
MFIMTLMIDLTDGTVIRKDYEHVFGGRSLSSKIIAEKTPPTIHPLDSLNALVIAPTTLAGTSAPNVNRLSVGAKSPLTGGIKEANVGGRVPDILARLGHQALIVQGKAERLSILRVSKEKCWIEDGTAYEEMPNYQLYPALYEQYGEKVGILAIGPAGEKQLLSATVSGNDLEGNPSRHAARGGLGAVLGSKNLKAIVFDNPGKGLRKPTNEKEFKELSKNFSKKLIDNSEPVRKFGNLLLVGYINSLKALPINNYRISESKDALSLTGENVSVKIIERGGKMGHRCSRGCVICCSNIIRDENGDYVTSGFEYETTVMLGSNLGLFDFESVVAMERICDDLGIDTIEIGTALATAAEANLATFGDSASFMKLIMEIQNMTPLGIILASGSEITGKVFGVTRVASVKGQGLAAYDPRGIKGTGVTYATSPMGGDHTAANLLPGTVDVDVRAKEGQTKASKDVQAMVAAIDSCGCIYVGITEDNIETFASLIESFYDQTCTGEQLLEIGRATLKLENEFNIKAGISPKKNDLPSFFRDEPDSAGDYFDIEPSSLEKIFN